MKALVTYLSQTGNTKKVAEAIFGELSCEKELKKIDEVSTLSGYDIVFAGFPVWQFGPAEPAKKFLIEHAEGKRIALFVTHAMDPESPDSSDRDLLKTVLEKCKFPTGGELAGFFSCRGELSINIADFLLKNSDPALRKFGEMRNLTLNHPDTEELNAARIFAKDIINSIL